MHIAKQKEIIGAGKKRTSNERKAENVDEIDSNELPKLKRKRLAESIATEPKPSTSAPLKNNSVEVQPVKSKTVHVPEKVGRGRRKLSEQDEPAADVDTTKRTRGPVKTSGDSANEERTEKNEAETHKRSRRQVTLKTIDYVDHEEENKEVGKSKRGRRPVATKAPEVTKKVDSVAKKPNDIPMIEVGAKDSVNKVNVSAPTVEVKRTAPEDIKTSKQIRAGSKALQKSNENVIDVASAVSVVPAQSTNKDKDIVEQELPKRTRRKRNYSEDETSSEQSKDFAGYGDHTTDRKDVKKAKDQIVEEKTASDASIKTIGSRNKITVPSSIVLAAEEMKKPEQNVGTAKPVRANRRGKANIVEATMDDKSEAAQPSTNKRVRKGTVEAPEAPSQSDQPKQAIRSQPKQTESGTIHVRDTSEPIANPDNSAMKRVSDTDGLVSHDRGTDVRAKRGRAAQDTKTPVCAPTKTNKLNQQGEIKTHVVETVPSVELEQKSTRGRKKNQKEHAAIDENKSSEAAAAPVASAPQRETVPQIQSALIQRSTRGRKRTQSELTDDNNPNETVAATVPIQQQRKQVAPTDAATESAPKQKSTRGRKKNPELEFVDKNKPSEATPVTIAPEQQREKVAEAVPIAEPAPKQKSARGRRHNQQELTDEIKSNEVAAAAVASVQQRNVVVDAVATTESKQKSTRGRKKIQPELAAIDENRPSEAAAAPIAPDQQQEVAPKPKSKKRAKSKDEPSDELMLKRGKLHAEPIDMKEKEPQPTAPSSRPTRHPKDGAQDTAVPSSSTAVRKTRSARSTKK